MHALPVPILQDTPWLIWVHEDTNCTSTRWHNQTLSNSRKSPWWLRSHGDPQRNVRTATGLASWPKNSSRNNWHIIGTLSNPTHRDCGNMSLTQCGSTYVWTIWYWVYWKRTSTRFIWYTTKENIWDCGRSDRWPILRDYIEMELQEAPCGSCYASISHEINHNIHLHCPLETTALPVFTQSRQIRQRQLITLSPWQKSSPRQSTKETHPTNCWQLPLICASSGSYYIIGIVGNSLGKSSTN